MRPPTFAWPVFCRLTANGSVYWADYTDKQEFVLTPTLSQSTFNVPEVDIKGFELQLSYRATDALRFDASYGYIDTEMKDFRTSHFLGPRDYRGNKTTYTPPYSLNVGAQFDAPVAASGLEVSAQRAVTGAAVEGVFDAGVGGGDVPGWRRDLGVVQREGEGRVGIDG